MKIPRYVVGITGGIGSGKSSLLTLLKRRGWPCASSDALAHDCLKPGGVVHRRIRRYFGSTVIDSLGHIDRKRLAAIVFSNAVKRKRLESFVHPCVIVSLKDFIARHRGLLFVDIPLLYEAHLENLVDFVVCVSCTRRQQIDRVLARQGGTKKQVIDRLRAQWPLRLKAKKANFVVDNSGPVLNLTSEAKRLLNVLRRRNQTKRNSKM